MKLFIIFIIIVVLLIVYAIMTSNWIILIVLGSILVTALIIWIIVLKSRTIIITKFNPLKEYIILKNVSNKTIDVTGWKIKDNNNNVYSFEEGFTLKKGESVQIQSGDKNEIRKRFDNVTHYIDAWKRNIWDDTGDVAYLINKEGKTISKVKAKATY